MTRSRNGNSISAQFVPHIVDLLESPAWRVLSLSARRVLDRIEIEHMHHGGVENGKLPVSYDDFVKYGIDRHAVAPAIREVIALGLLVITEEGRAGNAEFRRTHKFRLTYRPAKGEHGDGTHEWRKIKTIEQAELIAKAARLAKNTSRAHAHSWSIDAMARQTAKKFGFHIRDNPYATIGSS